MRALRDPNTLVGFEMRFSMSSSSEIEEDMIDPRYVKEELKVIRVLSERMIGDVSAMMISVPLFGMWRTYFFDLFLAVPVCIYSLNFLKCVRARFAVLFASSRVGRMKVISST